MTTPLMPIPTTPRDARLDEQAFMERHAGWAARAIFCIADALA